MIIDRLAATSPWVREFCGKARVIQAPFAILPPHESKLLEKSALVPRDGDKVSGQFAKPLFDRTVVFGNGAEGREQGALFVESSPIESMPPDLRKLASDDATHVLLTTVAGLTSRFECLVAYRFVSFCGMHFTAPPDMALVNELSKKAFQQVNGFTPESAGAEIKLDRNDWRDFLHHQVGSLAALFALMNCKNVVREAQVPDKKLQRARQRSGKHPLYAFSILKARPLGRAGAKSALDRGNRAIHWVRGHFKEYTPERPLFGKLAGLFWWEPHIAGSATD